MRTEVGNTFENNSKTLRKITKKKIRNKKKLGFIRKTEKLKKQTISVYTS